MKIGIVSDTHKNRDLLNKVVQWLVKRQKIPTLYHLGDDYSDVAGLGDRFSELLQVPGIYNEKYISGELPAKAFETILGITILLVHCLEKDATDGDISRSDIILHGHTHRQELRLDDGKLFFNPGHLKGPLEKNMPPTFGVLNIHDRDVSATIYGLDFKAVHTMEMIRSESGLYRAG
ncbi:MAG: metallophosphoesterase family protein [Chitinispirillaceae bacterium]|nr:metallophosphoesterase family protein [Chitinispirillaceae bacterium]